MVNTTENDIATYTWAVEQARLAGNSAAEAAITQYGPPPFDGLFAGLRYANYLDAGEFQFELQYAASNEYWANPFAASEFGLLDDLHALNGTLRGMDTIYVHELRDLDFEAQVPQLALPVYLIEGRFDHNASSQIAERWFNKLQAPGKQFIWFEHSGHPPYDFEPTRFNALMLDKVLAETYPGSALRNVAMAKQTLGRPPAATLAVLRVDPASRAWIRLVMGGVLAVAAARPLTSRTQRLPFRCQVDAGHLHAVHFGNGPRCGGRTTYPGPTEPPLACRLSTLLTHLGETSSGVRTCNTRSAQK
jgi:hypothetical protein